MVGVILSRTFSAVSEAETVRCIMTQRDGSWGCALLSAICNGPTAPAPALSASIITRVAWKARAYPWRRCCDCGGIGPQRSHIGERLWLAEARGGAATRINQRATTRLGPRPASAAANLDRSLATGPVEHGLSGGRCCVIWLWGCWSEKELS